MRPRVGVVHSPLVDTTRVEARPLSALHCVASSSETPFQPLPGHEDSLTRPGSGSGRGQSRELGKCDFQPDGRVLSAYPRIEGV